MFLAPAKQHPDSLDLLAGAVDSDCVGTYWQDVAFDEELRIDLGAGLGPKAMVAPTPTSSSDECVDSASDLELDPDCVASYWLADFDEDEVC